ncbi:4a-hydroxytetrahydrobiopterin dehydratase [Streptomyces palmae]|uniref:Putative pterin-4-alpha-carbinolamine dehydratase n=1 Tax=Streptomyces palmae TaxID=1701085 RepID=A0A4Z0GC80_9ACTN|nr:4a-hydroxytetrahydrobiopterin dehydratase [Streptomyces palmae]TGA93668.1 4a-hydroxytetrahydrobiopterin dehydratase [Streptomyces palmae]
MAVEPLSPQEIDARLESLPGWSVRDDWLIRDYAVDSHLAGADLIGRIARIQDELDHHADLTLSYRTVAVSVNTHSVGGKVTDLDFQLAHRIQQIAPEDS